MEIWKDIKGYEGIYQISDLGRVKSLKRKAIQPTTGHIRTVNRKIRKTNLSKNGYEMVVLIKDSKTKNISIHRLVALNFIENKNNYKCVNHINGIKTDNCVSNLEWCSYKQNTNHSIYTLGNRLKPIISFDLNGNKLKEFDSIKQASKELGIFPSCISAVLRGLQTRAYNYKFEYKKES